MVSFVNISKYAHISWIEKNWNKFEEWKEQRKRNNWRGKKIRTMEKWKKTKNASKCGSVRNNTWNISKYILAISYNINAYVVYTLSKAKKKKQEVSMSLTCMCWRVCGKWPLIHCSCDNKEVDTIYHEQLLWHEMMV